MKRIVFFSDRDVARKPPEWAESSGLPEDETERGEYEADHDESFAKILHGVQDSGLFLFVTMPIYEFYCPENHKVYSFFARSLAYAGMTPRCPDNPKWKMEKLISGFAITGRAKRKAPEAAPGGEGFDDPRMERAMAEMEREFSTVGDTDDPDPKTLARMMRKMTDLAGEKVPSAMREMIARMEKGESPEKLEAEYGDVLAELDQPLDGDDSIDPEGAAGGHRRPQITRDPALYEMADYVDR